MKRIGIDIDDTMVDTTKFEFGIYNKGKGKTKSVGYETFYVFNLGADIYPKTLLSDILEIREKHFKDIPIIDGVVQTIQDWKDMGYSLELVTARKEKWRTQR